MQHEEMILESVKNTVAESVEALNVCAAIAEFVANKVPGLSSGDRAQLLEHSKKLLNHASAQRENLGAYENVLRTYKEAKKRLPGDLGN